MREQQPRQHERVDVGASEALTQCKELVDRLNEMKRVELNQEPQAILDGFSQTQIGRRLLTGDDEPLMDELGVEGVTKQNSTLQDVLLRAVHREKVDTRKKDIKERELWLKFHYTIDGKNNPWDDEFEERISLFQYSDDHSAIYRRITRLAGDPYGGFGYVGHHVKCNYDYTNDELAEFSDFVESIVDFDASTVEETRKGRIATLAHKLIQRYTRRNTDVE